MKKTLLVLALSTGAIFAQKADFSGSWVMNKAKSDFGQMPEQMIPDKLAMKIASTATELKASTTQSGARGENTSDATYKLDGATENVNQAMGSELKTVAKWKGDDTVVLVSSREVQGMTLNIEQHFAKTVADAILVTTKIAGTPMGDIVMKYHLDRVTSAADAAPSPAAKTAPPAAASAAPVSFAGSWKLNKAKSNFGQMPEEYQPSAITRVIAHDDKLLNIKSTQSGAQGDMTADLKINLDGTESTNQFMGGDAKTVGKWTGPSITTNTKRDIQGMSLDITEKWVKINDKVMNVETKIGGTPMGEIVMTYVFEKE